MPQPRRIFLQVQFEHDSTTLAASAKVQLDELWKAQSAPSLRGRRIQIIGHTDATGSAEYNQKLSERRAAAVRGYLALKGPPVDPSLISIAGYGESQLLPDLPPDAPGQRRVEIRLQ